MFAYLAGGGRWRVIACGWIRFFPSTLPWRVLRPASSKCARVDSPLDRLVGRFHARRAGVSTVSSHAILYPVQGQADESQRLGTITHPSVDGSHVVHV